MTLILAGICNVQIIKCSIKKGTKTVVSVQKCAYQPTKTQIYTTILTCGVKRVNMDYMERYNMPFNRPNLQFNLLESSDWTFSNFFQPFSFSVPSSRWFPFHFFFPHLLFGRRCRQGFSLIDLVFSCYHINTEQVPCLLNQKPGGQELWWGWCGSISSRLSSSGEFLLIWQSSCIIWGAK